MEPRSDRTVGLTYEHVLWALIVLVALAMRVARLGAAPLTAGEAREALLAWRAATGQGMPLATYNPMLFAANSLLFTLFGTSDALARLMPMLFGVCLVLVPILFRRHLGRVGALASGLYLAVSPTALIASRQLDGTVIGGAATMAFLGGMLRLLETGRRHWLTFAAVGLGLAVTAGTTVYGVLLPLALAYAILSQLGLDRRALVSAHAPSQVTRYATQFSLTFAVTVFLFATGIGWNLPGLGASGGLLADWLKRFRPTPDPTASPLTLLTVYDVWVLVFGVGGAIWGVRQRNPVASLLGLWAALEMLLLTLMPGRAPTDLIWAVLPLAMLAGLAVEALASNRSLPGGHGKRSGELRVVHFAIALVLWVHAYLMLARYAAFGDRVDLVLGFVAVVLQGLVGLSFGLVLGEGAAFRTAAVGASVALLAFTLGAGWGVAYRRPADPREALLREPTAMNVRDLTQTLEDLSWQETGMPTTLAFPFEAPQDSVLVWYLRGFDRARHVGRLQDLPADEIGSIAVTAGRDDMITPADEEYAGQDFPLRRTWTPGDLRCRFWESDCAAVDWFLFRDGVPLPEADRWATLWRIGEASPTK